MRLAFVSAVALAAVCARLPCLRPDCRHADAAHTATNPACAELPQERLDELFMIPMPASRQAAQQQQAYQQHAERRRQQQEQQQQQEQEQEQQQRGTPSVAQQWPSRQGGGAGAADEAGPSSQGAAAGPSTSDGRAGKKARRAQERAYNEAVIGEASGRLCCLHPSLPLPFHSCLLGDGRHPPGGPGTCSKTAL